MRGLIAPVLVVAPERVVAETAANPGFRKDMTPRKCSPVTLNATTELSERVTSTTALRAHRFVTKRRACL
jgi:hypothetical protein